MQALDSIFNFLPGFKRYITIAVAVGLFTASQFGVVVPDWVNGALAIFGFNALAQAPKNQ